MIKDGRSELSIEEYTKKAEIDHKIEVQGMMAKWLVRTFVIVTFLTMAIFFLQGFDFCRFQLPESLLKWLGAATLGEIAGLLIIIIKAIFQKNK
jgi:uncharacterized membrane protein